MGEKVKLPKELCDVFDRVLNCAIPMLPSDLFLEIATGAGTPTMYLAIKNIDHETIMRALVLGYEPEQTPEERIKKIWDENELVCDFANGIREGIKQALRIHGIEYDWLDSDAE